MVECRERISYVVTWWCREILQWPVASSSLLQIAIYVSVALQETLVCNYIILHCWLVHWEHRLHSANVNFRLETSSSEKLEFKVQQSNFKPWQKSLEEQPHGQIHCKLLQYPVPNVFAYFFPLHPLWASFTAFWPDCIHHFDHWRVTVQFQISIATKLVELVARLLCPLPLPMARKPGLTGTSRVGMSPVSMETTRGMFGRSVGASCVQRRATRMSNNAWASSHMSRTLGSMRSKIFPPSSNCQAWTVCACVHRVRTSEAASTCYRSAAFGFISCLQGEKRERPMKVVKSNQQMVRWFDGSWSQPGCDITTIPKQHGDACSYPAVISLKKDWDKIKKGREAHSFWMKTQLSLIILEKQRWSLWAATRWIRLSFSHQVKGEQRIKDGLSCSSREMEKT